MEITQIKNHVVDLKERLQALRGYL